MRQPPEDDETGAQAEGAWDPAGGQDRPPLPLWSTPRLSSIMSIGVPVLLLAFLLALVGSCAVLAIGLWVYSWST
ncbi:hypothetical protein [Dactylosporangium sp. CA-139066]|uniref:hypothetical protein n=1 Tax=Dactylosporangium sp. CA-139066 TaxID=3239930 RepID=UPI003D94DF31